MGVRVIMRSCEMVPVPGVVLLVWALMGWGPRRSPPKLDGSGGQRLPVKVYPDGVPRRLQWAQGLLSPGVVRR